MNRTLKRIKRLADGLEEANENPLFAFLLVTGAYLLLVNLRAERDDERQKSRSHHPSMSKSGPVTV